MSEPSEDLVGIVLCGGKSSRMGRDKAELCLPSGLSFLEHAFKRLGSVCPTVWVSGAEDRKTNWPLVPDPPESQGPIFGILASLEHAARSNLLGCLFTPVDTPNLSVIDLGKLVTKFRSNPERIVCAVSDSGSDRLEPLIAVYPVSVCYALRDAIDRQEFGLQRLLQTMNVARVTLDRQACQNINDPDDYKLFSGR